MPPAAMHSKCLVCDKPVNPIVPGVMTDSNTNSLSRSNSPTHINSNGYDKKNDLSSTNNKLFTHRPTSSSNGVLNIPGTGKGGIGRAQSAKSIKSNAISETNIMKNSMEYFPPVTNGNNNLTPNPLLVCVFLVSCFVSSFFSFICYLLYCIVIIVVLLFFFLMMIG